MQINLTITVKGITAQSHEEAKELARRTLMNTTQMKENLWALGVYKREEFVIMAKSYREADGTFTVTIP